MTIWPIIITELKVNFEISCETCGKKVNCLRSVIDKGMWGERISLDCPCYKVALMTTESEGRFFRTTAKIDLLITAECKKCQKSIPPKSSGFWGWPRRDGFKDSFSCSNCQAKINYFRQELNHWADNLLDSSNYVVAIMSDKVPPIFYNTFYKQIHSSDSLIVPEKLKQNTKLIDKSSEELESIRGAIEEFLKLWRIHLSKQQELAKKQKQTTYSNYIKWTGVSVGLTSAALAFKSDNEDISNSATSLALASGIVGAVGEAWKTMSLENKINNLETNLNENQEKFYREAKELREKSITKLIKIHQILSLLSRTPTNSETVNRAFGNFLEVASNLPKESKEINNQTYPHTIVIDIFEQTEQKRKENKEIEQFIQSFWVNWSEIDRAIKNLREKVNLSKTDVWLDENQQQLPVSSGTLDSNLTTNNNQSTGNEIIELTTFSDNSINSQQSSLPNLTDNIHSSFTPQLIQPWTNQNFTPEQTKQWIEVGLTANEANFAAWLRDIKSKDVEDFANPQWIKEKIATKDLDLNELRQAYQEESKEVKIDMQAQIIQPPKGGSN
ncbi:hypothetical protein [endosymbiont GvMRE of Glomus versiforme]|uniref:hypothetical protein n=1 Tax=endosymbiont GvMRE of Glomus versiforme TaxID=2039283 RepID=UPI000EC420DD|nr:hypothetical protein [endosymbiont GvMRE of Glomus versiforme]RHZ37044.1 Serine/threonine protein kinase [endosymbiont GvMRE of Glomus versiforme]